MVSPPIMASNVKCCFADYSIFCCAECCHFSESHYAECRYAESRIFYCYVMLSYYMLNVVMLYIVMLKATQFIVMVNVVVNVVMS